MSTPVRPPQPKPVAKPSPEESVLKTLANNPEDVKAFGKTYKIKRFNLGQIVDCTEYAPYIGFLLKQLMATDRDSEGKPQLNESQMVDFAASAVNISGPTILGLISIATEEPVEWLREQEGATVIGDMTRVFAKVVEKNLDFFTQQNLDDIKAAFAPLMQRILQFGGNTSTI